MKKKKPLLIYVSPKSSSIKEFNISFRRVALILAVIIATITLTLKYSVDFIADISQNSKISQLKKDNATLEKKLAAIGNQARKLKSSLDFIIEKDDQIRVMLNLPEISQDVRKVGIGGSNPFMDLDVKEASWGNKLTENKNLLDQLEREIRLQKVSYQKLITTIERRQDSLQYLPVLKPIGDCYISSHYGRRMHPILKKWYRHPGIDLAARKGTPIYAPADGIVTSARINGGYGKMIKINHKYGFQTRYGHLHRFHVRRGQEVKRGDKIGEVGSTGLSTGSHLHYEVIYQNKTVNPIEFFLNINQ